MRRSFDIRRFCAWLIGMTFLFSGLSKLMDPVGTSYIMKEYFHFFHLSFLDGAAAFLGICLSLLESFTGVLLVTGIFRSATAWVASGMIGFFLLVTLILLLVHPEMECGCFGEGIHLSHFQTFVKNILLALLAAGAWAGRKDHGRPRRKKYVSALISMLSIIVFMIFSLLGLPLQDNTGYAPGNKLLSADSFATTAKTSLKTLFQFEKEGERVSREEPFRPGPGWRFAGMKTELVTEELPAGDLPLTDRDGTEISGLLSDGPVMVISLYDKPGEKKWERLTRTAREAEEAGFQVVMAADKVYYNDYPLYLSDRKTLSTFNRSNGGLTYLYDGEIIAKWSYAFRPDAGKLTEIAGKDYVETASEEDGRRERLLQGFLLYLFAVLMFL